jgi:hypothetical protein
LRLKNPILEFAIVLLLTLSVMAAFSLSSSNFKIWNTDVKKPGIKEFLFDKPPVAPPVAVQKAPGTPKTAIKPRIIDTTPQRILMVGESMIEGLMFPFMHYAKYNGDILKAKIWYGSRILDWGRSDTLKHMIDSFKPTFIIISVASNELFIKNIDSREPEMQHIAEQLKGYNYVWIGPPNPKKDNGINALIQRNLEEGRFFMSKYMHFDRRRDGVHPVPESSRKWADSIAVWIMEKSKQPIRLLKEGSDSTLNARMEAMNHKPAPAAKPRNKVKAKTKPKHRKHK